MPAFAVAPQIAKGTTDDQLEMIAGKRDQLAGKIQEMYGVSKDEVEKQIFEWQERQKQIGRLE